MVRDEKLLPCPFCGRTEIEIFGPPQRDDWCLECANGGCSAMPAVYGETREEVVGRWNVRSAHNASGDVEEVARALADRGDCAGPPNCGCRAYCKTLTDGIAAALTSAIAAERERAAKIAEETSVDNACVSRDAIQWANDTALQIAAVIRGAGD